MRVKNISFPTPLSEIPDIYNDNTDVFVELENEYSYTVIVGTYKNALTLMNRNKGNFIEPGDLTIIVRKLTLEIITEAVETYSKENAYWLKLYNFAGKIDIKVLDKLEIEQAKYEEELFKN